MMRRLSTITLSVFVILFLLATPLAAMAAGGTPTPTAEANAPLLTIFTTYPSQVIGLGESVTLSLSLKATKQDQVVKLAVTGLPTDWKATFRGEGREVSAVYVAKDGEATVDLQVDQPASVKAGDYKFVVTANSDLAKAELLVLLTVKEKTPPKLTLSVELPTLKGTPTTTFRYSVTLHNEGADDQTVNLTADSPSNFQVTFTLSGQEVTNLPIKANETKMLDVAIAPVGTVQGGSYPVTLHAQGSTAQADLKLTAEVTGQAQIQVTAPNGLLSAQATANKESPVKVDIVNKGTAPARNITVSSSPPTGWTVTFDQSKIDEIPAGQQVEVTAKIKPAAQAVAGDYMITVNAQPADGASTSADFRITVLTSTLWGVVGIALIAVALGVVALAVVRFGRR